VPAPLVGWILEETTGLVQRGGFPRESRVNYSAIVVIIVFLFLAVSIIAIRHTAGLLTILTSIESPPAAYLPLGQNDHKAVAVPRINVEERHYITSSLFGTLRHLRSEGGFFALWRGFNANFFHLIARLFVNRICQIALGGVLPGILARIISSIISSLALGRFAMVCTHIQISKPRSTTWFTRLMSTPWSTARKTLPALASVTLLADLIGGLIHSLAAAGVDGPTRAIAILAPFLLFLGIVLPASAALVRVQASHLPEDIEPIVPFDRTFGKTDDRDLTLEEAWRSMGMHGWKRVARMSVKLAPMTVVLPPILVCGGFFFVRTYAEVP
jgi:hypothetical protein